MNPAHVVQFQVTLEQPLLATSLAGDPNESVSLDYLPGSLLRGALIGKYCRQQGTARLEDITNRDVRRLFFSGKTRYLNAYLQQNGHRLLPVPRAFLHPKGDPGELTDWATATRAENDDTVWQFEGRSYCHLDDVTVDDQEGGYEAASSGAPEDGEYGDDEYDGGECGEDEDLINELPGIRLSAPERQVRVHTARTRRFGRAMPRERLGKAHPDEFTGAVYRYESLAAGQTFTAFILCDSDHDAGLLRDLSTGPASLGGARSAGYGRVMLHDANVLKGENAATPWRESGGRPLTSLEAGAHLRLTLLSDVLLRDEHGQSTVTPEALEAELCRTLGDVVSLNRERTFLSFTQVGGFNGTWGLPLPQLHALAMGSVLTFDITGPITAAVLRELEAWGLGERRSEGFGRITVNQHSAEVWRHEQFPGEVGAGAGPDRTTSLDSESNAVAQDILNRILLRRLDERALSLAYDPQFAIKGLGSKAQIARLRAVLAAELVKDVPLVIKVRNFISDIRSRASASRQFERARIRGGGQPTPLLKWLDDQLALGVTGGEAGWNTQFDFRPPQPGVPGNLPVIGAVRATLPAEERTRVLLRFIDMVLERAVKDWSARQDD